MLRLAWSMPFRLPMAGRCIARKCQRAPISVWTRKWNAAQFRWNQSERISKSCRPHCRVNHLRSKRKNRRAKKAWSRMMTSSMRRPGSSSKSLLFLQPRRLSLFRAQPSILLFPQSLRTILMVSGWTLIAFRRKQLVTISALRAASHQMLQMQFRSNSLLRT